MSANTRYYELLGRIDNTNICETLIKAANKRDLEAGATFRKASPHRVLLTIQGDDQEITNFISNIKSKSSINSLHASIKTAKECDYGLKIEDHQFSTDKPIPDEWPLSVNDFI